MSNKFLPIAALLFTALIWGITLPLMKVNLEVIPPYSLAFARFLIASILVVFLVNLAGLRLKDFFVIAFFAFFGITLHIGLLLTGLANTSSIDAAFILTLSPLFSSLIAVLVIKEKIVLAHVVGILLAFLGTLIYIFYPYISGQEKLDFNLLADFLIFLAIVVETVYIIGSKKLFDDYHPSKISAVSFMVGAITFFPLAAWELWQDPTWLGEFSGFNLISILYLGIFSSFVAYSLLEWALEKTPVHVNGTISYLSPLISIVIATVFLNETLNPAFAVSMILVVIGIILVTIHKPKIHHHYHRAHKT